MSDSIILSSAYLPPVLYFAVAIRSNSVFIEKHEGFVKQTFRNRCYIYSANGKQALVVPVIRKNNTIITDVKVDYSSNWNKSHWRSIESAYNKSPFFLYYSDYFRPFYSKKFIFLFDLNIELTELIFKLLKSEKSLLFTEKFSKEFNDCYDYRNIISPKNKNPYYTLEDDYNQVFNEKFGFLENLSIVDLIFNMGNFSKEYLLNSNPNII